MKGILLGLMLLAGQAKAESIILPFQSFSDEFAVQALQQVLDDKFSVRGGTLDANVFITTLTLNGLRVYSGGKDVIISTATGASGEPGGIFMRGLTGHVGIGTSNPDEVMEVQTRGDQGGILITTGPTNYGTIIGNYQGGTQEDFYSLVEPALPSGASPETLLRLNNQYNGSVWIGLRTEGSNTGTFYPGAVAGAGGDCSIATAPLPKLFVCNDKASAWAAVIYTTATSSNGLRVRNVQGSGTILQLETGGDILGSMSNSPTAVSTILTVGVDARAALNGRFDVYSDTSPIQSTANGSVFKLQHPTPNDVMLNAGGNGENLILAVEGSTAVTISSLAYVGFGRDPRYQVDASSFVKAGAFCDNGGVCVSTWAAIVINAVSLTTGVTGVLPIANGGTNNSSAYTAGSVIFSNGTSLTQDNSNLFWDDSADQLIVGPDSGDSSRVLITRDGTGILTLVMRQSADTEQFPAIVLGKSSGTHASPTPVSNGASVGSIDYRGYRSGGLSTTFASMRGVVEQEPTASTVYGGLAFRTSSSGGTTTAEKMRLTYDGKLGIGTTAPAYALDVSSFAKAGAFCDNTNICISTWTALSQYFVRLTGDTMTGTLNISSSFTATGQGVVGGTLTVQGAEFSVGGSTFVITGERVGIGTSSPASNAKLDIQTEATNNNRLQMTSYQGGIGSANINRFFVRSASGTIASPLLLPGGNSISQIVSQAYDGATFQPVTNINMVTATGMNLGASFGEFTVSVSTGGTSVLEAIRISSRRNFGVGATTFGNDAVFALGIAEGTPPTSSPADMVQLFSTSPAAGQAELYVLDEQGNTTLLSPHNFDLFQPNTTDTALPWSYLSRNFYAGKEINVDMLKLARLVEQLTGEQIVYTRDLPDSQVRDWAADEEGKRVKRDEEIAAWDAAEEKTGERPKPYVKKNAPAWLAPRLKRK